MSLGDFATHVSDSGTKTAAAKGPLPRGYMTPECRTGADRWPDLHDMCHAPGYEDRVLGWVRVPCACPCHGQTTKPDQEAGP